MSATTIAAKKILKMKPEFDYGRDLDGNKVTDTKFCMVSRSEWTAIRAIATASLKHGR